MPDWYLVPSSQLDHPRRGPSEGPNPLYAARRHADHFRDSPLGDMVGTVQLLEDIQVAHAVDT